MSVNPSFEIKFDNGSFISFEYLSQRDVIVIKGQDQLTQKDYTLTINRDLLAKTQPCYLPTVEDFFDILYQNFERRDWISPDFTISIAQEIVLSATKKQQHKFTFQLQEVKYTPEERTNKLAENLGKCNQKVDCIYKKISKNKKDKIKERLQIRKLQRQVKALMSKIQIEEVPTDQDSQEDSDDQS